MAAKSLSDWLSYIESQHPSEIELGLDRGLKVLAELDLKRPNKKVITVAGTNGKGSSCALITQYLISIGRTVGTYTSPHFLRFNERVSLNDRECSDELLINAFEKIENARKDTPLTFFEFSTLAALLIFSELELDYWVLEVGLGGRLDSVNMIDTDLAVVTSISLDHTDWLGDSLDVIAREKAGIARSSKPLVSGVVNPPSSISEVAQALNAPLYQKGCDFAYAIDDGQYWSWSSEKAQYSNLPRPKLPIENAATVIQALMLLDEGVSQAQLEALFSNATLKGRFELVEKDPFVYIDVAHNPEAANELKSRVSQFDKKPIAVIGMLKDKDIASVLDILKDAFQSWKVCSLNVPRGASKSELLALLPSDVKGFDEFEGAYSEAVKQARVENRPVVIFGSFVTVSHYLEMREL
ncbi:bifunctional tetrahydrofolate synthase/dihydrofolate synthase [Marinomonas mediterranea]|jgi:folylpolyglutamate synthase/dihydrofolate synthase|uniref:Dihydrofolate synthase/folylpolyglutamate synthase n=1 Tax=Marinomonas mediterranea (strain ATCC 700492 / JCM 21426 / NBRC 103028 / MMB-1) TaxID=717774 RepID=F2K3Y2_MARM1|nr:bifunctional tetrahydrofolate synthase/dihydrofolate synthase [Marinomonas mediterranea]ADZ91324.1 FolC bifunctional protein [Marinomonas mediterranea MMB-1]WCN09295.1 bifunctional tetrahydrofolate synthase/dihydrofolate synthase [Marinomonas mediterranea]WCN17445.1 bifunctional tetrahydrofolate synthase/dihydrofolate synthase [Marinomonas mediterranea MMB-1]